MKWISLLWSIVLLGGLALILTYLSSQPADVTIGPALGYAVTVWIVVCIISPIVVILRLFRIIMSGSSFVYILTGTASIAIGVLGIYFIAPSADFKNKNSILLVLLCNVLLGLFIFLDAFIVTIPGFRQDRSSRT